MTETVPPPEMSRLYPITRIGQGARFQVDSTPEERANLAKRMNVEAIKTLTCRFDLRRAQNDTIEADGLLQATLRQTCVVSLDPFDATIVEPFTLRFVPEGKESEDLDPDAADEIPYQAGLLDLGEAASEQLALAIDPFPRKPGAELPESLTDLDPSPFAALSKWLPPQ